MPVTSGAKLYYHQIVGQLSAIAQFFDPEEAYCARGYLQSHGIDSIIQNEHHLTMVPWLRVALGGYRLLVITEFEEEARQALKDVSEINVVDETAQISPQHDVALLQQPAKKNWIWFPVAFLTSVPFLPTRTTGWIGAFQSFILMLFYSGFVLALSLSFS